MQIREIMLECMLTLSLANGITNMYKDYQENMHKEGL